MLQLARIVGAILNFYGILIIVYVLLSWFPNTGVLEDIKRVMASVVEPYLGIFRRFIPPLGAIDISPIVAYLVLQLFSSFVVRILAGL